MAMVEKKVRQALKLSPSRKSIQRKPWLAYLPHLVKR